MIRYENLYRYILKQLVNHTEDIFKSYLNMQMKSQVLKKYIQ